MKISSRTFRDKYTFDNDPTKYCQMLSMVSLTDGKMAPFPGGVLMKNNEGSIIGAVGVSGASSDEDEYCGIRGIIESGFEIISIPEKHSCSTIKDSK